MSPKTSKPFNPGGCPCWRDKHKDNTRNPHDDENKGEPEEVDCQGSAAPWRWKQLLPPDDPSGVQDIPKWNTDQRGKENHVEKDHAGIVDGTWDAGQSKDCLVRPPTSGGSVCSPTGDKKTQKPTRKTFLDDSFLGWWLILDKVFGTPQHSQQLSCNGCVEPGVDGNPRNQVEGLKIAHPSPAHVFLRDVVQQAIDGAHPGGRNIRNHKKDEVEVEGLVADLFREGNRKKDGGGVDGNSEEEKGPQQPHELLVVLGRIDQQRIVDGRVLGQV